MSKRGPSLAPYCAASRHSLGRPNGVRCVGSRHPQRQEAWNPHGKPNAARPDGRASGLGQEEGAAAESLEGITIGLLDIGKARGDVFLNRLDERLTERGITVKRYAKPTPSRLVSSDTKQKMLAEVQSAVIGLAD